MFNASNHHVFMAQALRLAERGLYSTTPNPRVGCVIVKNNQVIGEGAHLKAGEAHAEVFALRQAGNQAQEADVYVTLEPCSHFGKTPPCVDALIAAKPRRVIVAMQDPNPLVAGQGIAKLEAHGIEVVLGVLAQEARMLNVGFIKRMTQTLPYVRSKIAASVDGKTALNNGKSQWITGDSARQDVQRWRAQSCAIMTGVGTVLADDPHLTVRLKGSTRQALRVIVDSHLRTPLHANVLRGGNVLIAYAAGDIEKQQRFLDAGVQLICLPNMLGKVCLKSLLSHLSTMQVNELLVEAGALLNGDLLQQHLLDELLIYQAPILLGHHARGMFDGAALTNMQQRVILKILETRMIDGDVRLRAMPVYLDAH